MKKRGAITIVGLDGTGYFKVQVPEGGRFTIAPCAGGMGPYALRIYRDRTNSSMILFSPNVQWIREDTVDLTRTVSNPEQLVQVLLEIAGISLTPDPGNEPPLVGSYNSSIAQSLAGTGLKTLINEPDPFYRAMVRRTAAREGVSARIRLKGRKKRTR